MPMKLCIFQKEDNEYKCVNCGFVLPDGAIERGAKRLCDKPSEFTKIKNFGKEIVKQGKNIVKGNALTSKEEIERRLAICDECEYYSNRTCALCGCKMPLKVRLEKANCPIGKW